MSAGMNFRAGMPGDIQQRPVMGGITTRDNGYGTQYMSVPAAAPSGGGASAPMPAFSGGAGSGAGAGSSAPPQAPYIPPPLPSVGPVPVNDGNLAAVGSGTETGSMMPPSAPGVGWQNMGNGGGLNDRLGTRLQRQSMNQLSQGIY